MVSGIILPEIYFYSELKKLLRDNSAQKGKNVKKTSLAKQQILPENGGECLQVFVIRLALAQVFKSRCCAVGL